jgi:hypothetical protein
VETSDPHDEPGFGDNLNLAPVPTNIHGGELERSLDAEITARNKKAFRDVLGRRAFDDDWDEVDGGPEDTDGDEGGSVDPDDLDGEDDPADSPDLNATTTATCTVRDLRRANIVTDERGLLGALGVVEGPLSRSRHGLCQGSLGS